MTQINYQRTTTMRGRNGQMIDSSKQTHLLCVEPNSQQLFSINLGTQEAEEVVLDKGQEITNKIKREEYKLEQLLDRQKNTDEWFFQNETAQNYRRQMVPFYLLEQEANMYPVYVDNSNIDESLTSDFKISEIRIKVSHTIWEAYERLERAQALKDQANMSNDLGNKASRAATMIPSRRSGTLLNGGLDREIQPKASFMGTSQRPIIREEDICADMVINDVSLLTTADKVIKRCEKEFENRLKGHQIQSKMQILKFQSVDSYAYGEQELIYFVEIREYLRKRANDKSQSLELVFISLGIDENQFKQQQNHNSNLEKKDMHFPPMLEIKQHAKSDTPQLFQPNGDPSSSRSATEARSRNTVKQRSVMMHDTVPEMAKRYKNVSIFNWYTPQSFRPKNKGKQTASQLAQLAKRMSVNSTDQNGEGYSNFLTQSPYCPSQMFEMAQPFKDRGNVPFLRDPDSGLIPYKADAEILKSCDIMFPLRINLLGLRDITKILSQEITNMNTKKGEKPLRLISYIAPHEPANSSIMSLLAQCQALCPNNVTVQDQNMKQALTDPFGNWGIKRHLHQAWQDMKFKVQLTKVRLLKNRSEKVFKMKPQYIQIQAALYLGCRRISTFSYSKPTLYGNELDFCGDFLQFHKPLAEMRLQKQKELDEEMSTPELPGKLLRIDCLPSCARICFNVILLPEPGCKVIRADKIMTVKSEKDSKTGDKIEKKFVQREGFVMGSCSVSLFDERFLIRQGKRDCRLWPFQSFQPRQVCQGECFYKPSGEKVHYRPNQIAGCMTIQIEFQSFAGKVGWRLQSAERRKSDSSMGNSLLNKHRTNAQDLASQKATTENVNLEDETKSLKSVKRLLDAYPLDLDDEEEVVPVEKVLEYRNYIHKMPIFIRLIDFTDHEKIGICYDTLDGSGLAKDMLPEESLALLDGLFGDIKVRIFAVKKLSMLNDSQIALFMPQLIQALKYELFHHSPLAEFLLEKALKNTRVVGHALFWSLKANLHQPFSRERFYLILERYLMCVGQMKNDFLKQVFVNRSLIRISSHVNSKLDDKDQGASKKYAQMDMHQELKREEIRLKLQQQLIIDHQKYDDMTFDENGQEFTHDKQQRNFDQLDNEISGQIGIMRKTEGAALLGQRPATQFINTQNEMRMTSKSEVRSYQKYTFDEREINDFIEQKVQEVMEKITFEAQSYRKFMDAGNQDADWEFKEEKPLEVARKAAPIFYKNWRVEWKQELLYMPFAPKNPFSSFADKGGAIFMSKKRPLLIVVNLANETETEKALASINIQNLGYHQSQAREENKENDADDGDDYDSAVEMVKKKFLFKCGDDLRQDNLVLQFFKIMDRLWQSGGDNMRMMCYDVLETGFETGYIEFVDQSTVITDMHQHESFMRGPFRERAVINFFKDKVAPETPEFSEAKEADHIKKSLEKYNKTYRYSLAGQCVATYVLGIRDRHPGNFMLQNATGMFFHIDFGHFLGACKSKMGFKRDREPFILSNELHYMLKNICLLEPVPIAEEQGADSLLESSMQKKKFKLELKTQQNNDKKDRNKEKNPSYQEEAFEKLASQAFLKIRQNADIFINLLVLMLVAELEELDEKSIGFVKNALFLNVSEEEATVQFKHTIDEARKQWYRPIDNLFHVISDWKKEKKQRTREDQARKKRLSLSASKGK